MMTPQNYPLYINTAPDNWPRLVIGWDTDITPPLPIAIYDQVDAVPEVIRRPYRIVGPVRP